MNSSFSISEAFSYGWDMFKKYWKFLVPYILIYCIITITFSILGNWRTGPLDKPLAIFVYIISIFVNIYLSTGFIRAFLMIYDNKPVSISKNLFATKKDTWKCFKVMLGTYLYMLPYILGIGLLVFIPTFFASSSDMDSISLVTGLLIFVLCIFLIRFIISIIFSQQIALDHDFGIFESIDYSKKIVDGNKGKIFILVIVSVLYFFLGAILLFVGIFVAIPVMFLAQVYVYKKLDAAYMAKNGVAPHTPDSAPIPAPNAEGPAPTTVEIQPEEIVAPKVETKE